MLLEDVDVREIRLRVAVGEGSREPRPGVSRSRGRLRGWRCRSGRPERARLRLWPRGLVAQVPMNRRAVDARRVVVELLPLSERALHGRGAETVDNSAQSCCTFRRPPRTRPGSDPELSRGTDLCSSAHEEAVKRAQPEAAVELVRRDDYCEGIAPPSPQAEPVVSRRAVSRAARGSRGSPPARA